MFIHQKAEVLNLTFFFALQTCLARVMISVIPPPFYQYNEKKKKKKVFAFLRSAQMGKGTHRGRSSKSSNKPVPRKSNKRKMNAVCDTTFICN